MVRRRVHYPEMRTTYLLKSGQTLENTRPSERPRALIMTKDTFQRFVDYITEKDKIMAQQEKEVAKITALKKATYEKSKTWENKLENIKARRREELLSKKQKAEEERKMFVKEMTLKKAAERAEVVQKARKLLLQKKPLCRRINRALLASECLRELDAQVAFQKTIRAMDEKQETEYVNSIKMNVAEYEEQKKQEAQEQANKTRDYRIELKKQIEENERDNKLKAAEELEAEKQDQRNMTQYIQFMREKEMHDILNKKKKLQQFFTEAIEEKKRFELELKRNEEFEDRALEIYRKSKDRIQDIHKSITLKEKEEKARQMQIIAEQHESTEQTREAKEQELLKKAVEEKEAIEAEKRKAQKEREETMRALMEEYKLYDAAIKTKQRQDEKTLKAWKMIQRFNRSECDKQTNLEERKRQWQQKLEYGKELRKDIEEKQIEKKREEILEIKATSMKAAIEKANQRILLYGDEVLEESKGVRPLYPIIKAIEECKKEMGLIPTKKVEETVRAERPKRKRGIRRTCTKPVPVDQKYFRIFAKIEASYPYNVFVLEMSGKDGEPKEKKKQPIPPMMNFLLGGLSGMTATCVVHPMDVIKNRMQVHKGKASILNIIGTAYSKEGITSFYSGLTAGLVRQATYTTVRLGIYNQMQDFWRQRYIDHPNFAVLAFIAGIAGATGAFVGTPADVALVRMTIDGRLPIDQRRNYKNVFDAFIRIAREEGIFALWRGGIATIGRSIVVNISQLATYSQVKHLIASRTNIKEGIGLHFCASMISGIITTFNSMPFDVTKTRIQNMKSTGKLPGMITVMMSIAKNEGIGSLWKGFWPTYCRIGPHTVLTFVVNEQLMNLYRTYTSSN